MTIPARYTLTEAHFRIAELEEQLETLRDVLDEIADGELKEIAVLSANARGIAQRALAANPAMSPTGDDSSPQPKEET